MAHYDITHTCGHDERIELFGKTSERERRIEWLQERPCTECWKKERAAEAEARKNKEAAMIVEKLGNDASAPTDEEPRIVYDLSAWDFLSKPAEDRPTYLRFTADDKDSGSHAEIITNRHGEGRWLRDSATGDYIQISGTSQYRLPRTENALKCQLALRLGR